MWSRSLSPMFSAVLDSQDIVFFFLNSVMSLLIAFTIFFMLARFF